MQKRFEWLDHEAGVRGRPRHLTCHLFCHLCFSFSLWFLLFSRLFIRCSPIKLFLLHFWLLHHHFLTPCDHLVSNELIWGLPSSKPLLPKNETWFWPLQVVGTHSVRQFSPTKDLTIICQSKDHTSMLEQLLAFRILRKRGQRLSFQWVQQCTFGLSSTQLCSCSCSTVQSPDFYRVKPYN